MGGFWVPAGVNGRREQLSHLWKNLLDHGAVGANADPLPELWSHMNHQTVWRGASAPLLGPPALKLGLQRSQLEEAGLLIQQGELLQRSSKQRNIHRNAEKEE